MKQRNGLKKIGDAFVQSLFPRRCPVCEDIARGKYICPDCVKKLHFIKEPICMICGKEIRNPEMELCDDCTVKKRSFEFGRALLGYDALSEQMMVKLKYKNKREYVDGLAKLLVYRYRALIQSIHADCLMPVPIHTKRRRERGFNQAELIAKIVSRETQIPLDVTSLVRVKNTKAQKALHPSERDQNLKMAFLANPFPKYYKRVILIDDIFTTGSTIEACTKALKKEGDVKVYCFCLCIGLGRT